MAPPFLVAGGASHWPANPTPSIAVAQNSWSAATARPDAAKRSDVCTATRQKQTLRPVFCAAPPACLPACRPLGPG
jgi:hypothetical protein